MNATPRPFTDLLRVMVQAEMTRRGLSQRMMADRLGVDHSMLSRWFHGNRRPEGTTVDLVVEYFGPERIASELRTR